MTQPITNAAGFFNREMADAYDRRNSALKPISDCLHFLACLVLSDLPDDACILCVRVGTGAEILSLAAARPGWSFVGIDPSAEMIEVGQQRLDAAGVSDRCRLFVGYVDEVTDTSFDAVVSLLVAHFIQRADRSAFYRAIHDRRRPGGRFVSAEISGDLDADDFPARLNDWKQVQTLMGATLQSLVALPEMMCNVLGIMPPDETEATWRDAKFSQPVSFF